MNENIRTEAAEYFGLKVEVICQMEHCALVRCHASGSEPLDSPVPHEKAGNRPSLGL